MIKGSDISAPYRILIFAGWIIPPRTRCAPLPNQTPACRGLIILGSAGSGQARSRLGRGWGWGSLLWREARASQRPPPRRFAPTLPTKGEGKTEFAARADFHFT